MKSNHFKRFFTKKACSKWNSLQLYISTNGNGNKYIVQVVILKVVRGAKTGMCVVCVLMCMLFSSQRIHVFTYAV